MERSIRRIAIPIVSCILTLTMFRVFFFVGYVPSSSMEPTIPSKSFILANRTAYWFSEPQVGDWVIVHVGFALNKIDEAKAQETLSLMSELASQNAPASAQ